MSAQNQADLRTSSEQLKQKLYQNNTNKQDQSLQKKNPIIFRWKTGALVMGSIAAIVIVVNIVVLYTVLQLETVDKNLTFLTAIVTQSEILQTKQQLINLSDNFQQIYGQTKFQNAILIQRLDQMSQTNIKDGIYNKQNSKLLYLIQLQDSQQTLSSQFAIFMNSAFPIPKDEDFNRNTTYYSFEIEDERKSAVFSLKQNKKTLKFLNDNISSPLKCKTYNFQTGQNQGVAFRLLNNTIDFSLTDLRVDLSTENFGCFTPELSQPQFQQLLIDIIGIDFTTTADLQFKKAEVYFLE